MFNFNSVVKWLQTAYDSFTNKVGSFLNEEKKPEKQNVPNSSIPSFTDDIEQSKYDAINPYLQKAVRNQYKPSELARNILDKSFKAGSISQEDYDRLKWQLDEDPRTAENILHQARINYNEFINKQVKDLKAWIAKDKWLKEWDLIWYIAKADPQTFQEMLKDENAAKVIADQIKIYEWKDSFKLWKFLDESARNMASPFAAIYSEAVIWIWKITGNKDLEEAGKLQLVKAYAPNLSYDEIAKLDEQSRSRIVTSWVTIDAVLWWLWWFLWKLSAGAWKLFKWWKTEKAFFETAEQIVKNPEASKVAQVVEDRLWEQISKEIASKYWAKNLIELTKNPDAFKKALRENPELWLTYWQALKDTSKYVKWSKEAKELAELWNKLFDNTNALLRYDNAFKLQKWEWSQLVKSAFNIDAWSVWFMTWLTAAGATAWLITDDQWIAYKFMTPVSSALMAFWVWKSRVKAELAEKFEETYWVNPLDLEETNPLRQKFEKLVDFKYKNSSLADIFAGEDAGKFKYWLYSLVEATLNAYWTSKVIWWTKATADFAIDKILNPRVMDGVDKIKAMIDAGEDMNKILIESKRLASDVNNIVDQLRAARWLEESVRDIEDIVSYIWWTHSDTYKQLKVKINDLNKKLELAKQDPTVLKSVRTDIDEIKWLLETHLKQSAEMWLVSGLDKDLKQKLWEMNLYKNVLLNLKDQTWLVASLKKWLIKWLAPNQFSFTYNMFDKKFSELATKYMDEFVGSKLAFIEWTKLLKSNEALIKAFVDEHSAVSQVVRQKVDMSVQKLWFDPETSKEISNKLYNDLMWAVLKSVIYKWYTGEIKYWTDPKKVVHWATSEVLAKFFDIGKKELKTDYDTAIKYKLDEIDKKYRWLLSEWYKFEDVVRNYNYVEKIKSKIFDYAKSKAKWIKWKISAAKQAYAAYKFTEKYLNRTVWDVLKSELWIEPSELKWIPQEYLNMNIKKYLETEWVDKVNKLLWDLLAKVVKEVWKVNDKTVEWLMKTIEWLVEDSKWKAKVLLEKWKLNLDSHIKSLEEVVLEKISWLAGKDFEDTYKEIKTYNEYAIKHQLDLLKSFVNNLESLKQLKDSSRVYELMAENKNQFKLIFSYLKDATNIFSRKRILEFLARDDIDISRMSPKEVKELRKTLDELQKKIEEEWALYRTDIETLDAVVKDTLETIDSWIWYIESKEASLKKEEKLAKLKEIKETLKWLKENILSSIEKINDNADIIKELWQRTSIIEDYKEADIEPGVKSIPSENLLVQDLKKTLFDIYDKEFRWQEVSDILGIDKTELEKWNIAETYDTEKLISKLRKSNNFTLDWFIKAVWLDKVFKQSFKEYKEIKQNNPEVYNNFYEYLLQTRRELFENNLPLFRKFNNIFAGIANRMELYSRWVDRSKRYKKVYYWENWPYEKQVESDIVDYIFTPDWFTKIFGSEERFKKLFNQWLIDYVSFDGSVKQIVDVFDFVNAKLQAKKREIKIWNKSLKIVDDLEWTVVENYRRLMDYQKKYKKIFIPSSDTLWGYTIKYDEAKSIVSDYIWDRDLRLMLDKVSDDSINVIQSILLLKQYWLLDYKIWNKTIWQYIKENLNRSNYNNFIQDVAKIVHSNAKYNSKIFATEYSVEHKVKPKAILLDDNEVPVVRPDWEVIWKQETTDGNIYVFDFNEKWTRKKWFSKNLFIHDVNDPLLRNESAWITDTKLTYYFDWWIVKGKENLVDHNWAATLFMPYEKDWKLDTSNIDRLNRILKQEWIDYEIKIETDWEWRILEWKLLDSISQALVLLNERWYTRIIPKSSVKDFGKWLAEWHKVWFSFFPDNVKYGKFTAGKDILEINKDVYYNVYDGFDNSKLKDSGRTLSMQAIQHFYWNLWKQIISFIEKYNEFKWDFEYLKKIAQAAKEKNWWALYENIKQLKGNITESQSALIKKIFSKSWNLLQISHPNIVRVLTTVWNNNYVRRYILRWATLNTLSGMPEYVYNRLKLVAKDFGIDWEFIVASRRNLVKFDDWFEKVEKEPTEQVYQESLARTKELMNSWDYVYGIRYPIWWPKAERWVQVLFIEDVLEKYPEYSKVMSYFMDEWIPSASIFIPAKEKWLQEADYDGDQINMFWWMTILWKQVKEWWKTFSDLIKDYNNTVESIKETWDTATKSWFNDYNNRLNQRYGTSPIMPSLVRAYAKDWVSTVSIHARMNAIKDLAIFENTDINKLIKDAGRVSAILQAAVDGNASGKPGEILEQSIKNLQSMFPKLFEKWWIDTRPESELSIRWIDEFFLNDWLMAFNRKTNEQGKSLFWNELSSNVRKTITTYDKVVALKIAEKLLPDNATINDYKDLVHSIHREIILRRLKEFEWLVDKDKEKYRLLVRQLADEQSVKKFYNWLRNLVIRFDLPYYITDSVKETYSPFMNNKILKKDKWRNIYTDYIYSNRWFIDLSKYKEVIGKELEVAYTDVKSPANRLARPEIINIWRNWWINDLTEMYQTMWKVMLEIVNKDKQIVKELWLDKWYEILKKTWKLNRLLKYTRNWQIARKAEFIDENWNKHIENWVDNIINWIENAKTDEEAKAVLLYTSILWAEVPKDIYTAAEARLWKDVVEYIKWVAEVYKTKLYKDIGPMFMSSKMTNVISSFKKLWVEWKQLEYIEKKMVDYIIKWDEAALKEIELLISDPIWLLGTKAFEEFKDIYSQQPSRYFRSDMFTYDLFKTIERLTSKFEIMWWEKINNDAFRWVASSIVKDFMWELNKLFASEYEYMKDIEKIKNGQATPLNSSLYSLLKLLASEWFKVWGYTVADKKWQPYIADKYRELKSLYKQIVDKVLSKYDLSVLEKYWINEAVINSLVWDDYFFRNILQLYWKSLNNEFSSKLLHSAAASEYFEKMMKINKEYAKRYDTEINRTINKIKETLWEIQAIKMKDATTDYMKQVYDILAEDKWIMNRAKQIALEKIRKNKWLDPEQAFKEALDEILSKKEYMTLSKLQSDTVRKLKEASAEYAEKISGIMNEYTANVLKIIDSNLDMFTTPKKVRKEFENELRRIALQQDLKWVPSYNALSEFITFMNNYYKTQSLWIAIWRMFVEWANAAVTVLVSKFTNWITSLKDVANTYWFKEDIKIDPKIEKWLYWQEFELEKKLLKSGVEKDALQTWFRKLNELLWNLVKWIADKTYELPNQLWRNAVYRMEFARALNDLLDKRIWNDPAKRTYYEKILTSDKLTQEEYLVKQALLKEAWRRALKETKQMFFDYTNNPVLLAKLEWYVPFINFLYNWYKIYFKHPFTWTFLYNIVNTILDGSVEIDLDEDSFYIRAVKNKPGMISISLFWHWPYNIDVLRLLPIEPGTINIANYPWQKMFMPTWDRDYQRYIDGEMNLAEYLLKKTTPTLYDLYYSFVTGDTSRATRRLVYLTTWLWIQDETYKEAISAWFEHDYEKLKDPTYLNKLNQWRKKRWMVELTQEDIEAIEKFEKTRERLWWNKYDKKSIMTRKIIAATIASKYYDKLPPETVDKIYKVHYDLYDYMTAKELRDFTFNPEFAKEYRTLVKEWVISRLEKIWYDEDYIKKLRYYANNADLISEYYNATSRVFGWVEIWGKKVYDYEGKDDDMALILAMRYKFRTADWKPEDAVISAKDYKDKLSYYKAKAKLIKNWTLFYPEWVDNPNYKFGESNLTSFYAQHLHYTKWEVVAALQDYLAEVNHLTTLKWLYINKALHENSEYKQRIYWKIVKDVERDIIESQMKLKQLHPTAYEYWMFKNPKLKWKNTTILDIYKEEIDKDRKNYYNSSYRSSKKKLEWYSNINNIKDWQETVESSWDPNTLALMWKRINDMHQEFITNLK